MILIIFGAGGLGKEVAELAKILNKDYCRWDEICFHDDVQKETRILDLRVMNTDAVCKTYLPSEVEYIIALGEPLNKKRVYDDLILRGYSLTNLIAPDAQVSPYAKIGSGIIVKKGSIIQAEARVGDNVTLQSYVAIGHGAKIGNHCQLSTFSVIGGETVVGKNTYISMNCSIRDKISIGENVIVSAGSAVLKDVESNVTVAGNPARIVSRNTEDTRVFK